MPDLANRGPLGQKTGNPKRTASGRVHMSKVAQLGCVICGAPASVHHCISGRFGQRKSSDFDTIPLCWNHHQGPEGIHTNKAAWEERYGPDTSYLPIVADLLSRLP